MVAFLGTGLLGSNFTKALLAKDIAVQVWNRTADKAKVLEASGATAFDNITDAVKGIQRIHITLSDDAVVDAVLAAAEPALQQGAFIIDHSTTSVEGAVERTSKWAAKGIHYVHAPVFMGPINALESTGYMLLSGDQQVIEKVEPWLTPMTGQLIHFGDRTGKAAAMKLLGNLFLITLTGGLSDMLALAKATGVTVEDIFSLLESFNPGSQAMGRLKRITTANYDEPSWELQMARKDAGLMMSAAANAQKELVSIPAIAKQMDRYLEKGNAQKDWTIIASENR
ncbi:MAG TPA: NAD(P)-binding domain-containing protein [Phnomibacter sp.]|nr:NAD(P)-binding domain-containing protein [Phnomibacter sp.]